MLVGTHVHLLTHLITQSAGHVAAVQMHVIMSTQINSFSSCSHWNGENCGVSVFDPGVVVGTRSS